MICSFTYWMYCTCSYSLVTCLVSIYSIAVLKHLFQTAWFLAAFPKQLGKAAISFVMSVPPTNFPHETTWLPSDRFTWDWYWGLLGCQHVPFLAKLQQKEETLYRKTYLHLWLLWLLTLPWLPSLPRLPVFVVTLLPALQGYQCYYVYCVYYLRYQGYQCCYVYCGYFTTFVTKVTSVTLFTVFSTLVTKVTGATVATNVTMLTVVTLIPLLPRLPVLLCLLF